MPRFFPIDIHSSKTPNIGEFFVFGERNSGTNFADALLRNNFPQLSASANDRMAKHGFRYGWKHGFPQMIAAPDTTLAVVMFRDPERWVQSMHRQPWHGAKHLRELTFSDFLAAPWQSIVDEKNFGITSGADPRAYAELQWDRHPLTGARFDNILQLRNAKSAGFLSLKNRFSNVIFARYEDVANAPAEFINMIGQTYALTARAKFVSVDQQRGRKSDGKFVRHVYDDLTQTDRDFIWSGLDTKQEEILGYIP
ncbi:hypothetical protein GCM10008927_28340 [Amylibacter ulvae]|uniref:Sulfotransferase domain-containing protein n=1 Tax=Paramylibacter ulvae TaxID=1651968 RepID=A0ABQ3D8P0_9RHOB|nr:hypothetical protein [Amylibacter ulvae]GHA61228.1 hypothetical protein GCM10008927_28340 [Amylibacter ulvae]